MQTESRNKKGDSNKEESPLLVRHVDKCMGQKNLIVINEKERQLTKLHVPFQRVKFDGDRLPSGTFFFIIKPRSVKFGMRM